jgi:hypothetical protein
MSYKLRKINKRKIVGNRDLKIFIAMRQNGADLTDLVQDFGRNAAMGLESLYQKFYGGVV